MRGGVSEGLGAGQVVVLVVLPKRVKPKGKVGHKLMIQLFGLWSLCFLPSFELVSRLDLIGYIGGGVVRRVEY